MQIKPVQFTNDPQGLPATGYAYHIGLPNEDPLNDDNKLTVKDGLDGATISNPFYVDSLGHFINTNGQRVNPWIDEEKCSKVILSPAGGELYREENEISDRVTSGNIQDSVVDAVFNNFIAAKAANLTDYDTIYIESDLAGWEDTVAGPVDGFYAHADGTTGMPSSGSRASFFDSIGNGWREDDSQRLGDDSVTTIKIEDSAVTTIKIDNDAVTEAKIDDDAVTRDKISIPVGFPTSISTITATGTFNVPAGSKGLLITATAAGGGGAGTDTTPVTRGGAGGGEGATAQLYITNPSSSYSVTIGAGGAAGAPGGFGGTGGDTSFGGICIAKGGFGGSFLGSPGNGGNENSCTGDKAVSGGPGGLFSFQTNALSFAVGGEGGGAGGGIFLVNAYANSGGGGSGGGASIGGSQTSGRAGAGGKIIVEVF